MQYLCGMKERMVRKTPVNKRVFYLCIQVAINAVLIGVVAKVLVGLIDLITNLSFYGRLSFEPASPAGNHLGLLVLAVPVIGAVLVGLMARFGSKAIGGHGIPEAMEKIILEDSRIPPALTFLKPLSAAISIGTGGPFGAEGPIIATGGAFGSLTGQWMHISSAERKIVLAAGACSGMAAIFGSPLAAVLLAIELLLFEFSPRSIIPVVIGCVTGAGMHILLFGSSPVFGMPEIPAPSDSALAAYVVLGLIVGVVAAGVSRSIYLIEDLFEKLPVHWMWWPAIGAIAIGVTGYFAPHTMGVGYDNITYLLGGTWSWRILFSLCVLKYISWAVSLGSGTSGGTLAPLFTMGGGLGAMLGLGAMYFFPSLGIDPATAALAGMAAMFAGASRALLTSVVFALETTGQAHGVLPVLGASVAAYFLSFFLMRGSIMTEKIKRRGVSAPDAYEPDVLQGIQVKTLVLAGGAEGSVNGKPYVYASDDVGLAAEMMGKYNTDQLLVRDDGDPGKTVGIITAASILRYYSAQKRKEHTYHSPGRTRRIMAQGRKILFFNR
jgi:CIC family chloride channel protein